MVRSHNAGRFAVAAIFAAALFTLAGILPAYAQSDIVITEVMENPTDSNDEYVEIYNPTGSVIDVSSYWLTDGDEIDQLITWDAGGGAAIAGMTTNTTSIPAGAYALILDKGHTGAWTSKIPAGTVILTVSDAELGSALTGDDPVTLVKNYTTPPQVGTVVSTYGTPKTGDLSDWNNLDDDGLDAIPVSPGVKDVSVERRDLTKGDLVTNWGASVGGATPGKVNSINGTGPSGSIVINEAVIEPTTDQWVELINKGTTPVNMTGWVLTDLDGNIFAFPSFTLGAGAYVVVHFDATHTPADNTATDLYNGSGGFFTTTYDQVALYWSSILSSDTVSDFVAYRISGTFADGGDDDHAVTAGIWTDGTYFDLNGASDNQSFGLKVSGTDSNQTADWAKFTVATPGAPNPGSISQGTLVIDEVAFNSGGGTVNGTVLTEDWVEVRNISANPVNLKGMAFHTTTTSVAKTINADTTLGAGKFLLLHFDSASPDETDSTGDTSGDGITDIYTASPTGLTSTNAQFYILDASSSVADAVVWGNSGLTTTTTLAWLQGQGAWKDEDPAGPDANDPVPSDPVGTKQTIARNSSSTDTGSKADWSVAPNPTPGAATPAPLKSKLVINEVSFNGGGGTYGGATLAEDWVEIYCSDDGNGGSGSDISGLFFEDDSSFKTIGSGTTIKTGEYILLLFDSSLNDETTAGSDKVLELHTSRTGLTGTDEQIILKDPFGAVVDAVPWANNDSAWSSGEGEDVAALVAAGQWNGANEADCVPSNSAGTKDSIARDELHSDTNSRADWTVRSEPTPGADNGAPPSVYSFRVVAPAYALSGTPFDMTVTALNEAGEVIDTYSGTPDLAATNGAGVSPAEASGFVSGVAKVSVTLTGTTGTLTEVTVSDNGKTATTGTIEIVAAIPLPVLVVNEVAFKNGGSGFDTDWVEIFCRDDGRSGAGVNLRAYSLDDLEGGADKLLGDCTLKTGQYLLLHYKDEAGTSDETSLPTGEKAVDVYTVDTGLTDTDEEFAVIRPDGTVVDAVVWAEGDSITSTEIPVIQNLVNNGQWTIAGAEPAVSDCVASGSASVATGQSIARDGIGTDTNTAGDWNPSTVPTPGESNANGPKEDVVLKISEVAPENGGGGLTTDWIELYCADDKNGGAGANITGYYFEDDSKIKTLGTGTFIRTGDYILLQFGTEKADETEATGGVIRIYSKDSGLTGTDENVNIYNHLGKMVDAVVWTDGGMPDTEIEDMQGMIDAGQWIGTAGDADAVNTKAMKAGNSIARDRRFTDSNTLGDWTIRTVPSPGKVNASPGEPVAVVLLPEKPPVGLVGMEIDLTLEGRDITGAVTTAADFYVKVYSNSSTARFSMDGGFTWEASPRALVRLGTTSLKIKEGSPGRVVITVVPDDTFIASTSGGVEFVTPPEVVLNEVMYHPDALQGEASDAEWIELYNRGNTTVDLSGWKVTISGTATTLPSGLTMAPDSYLVIASDLEDSDGDGICFARLYGDQNGVWNSALDGFAAVDAKDFSLSDTSDTVSLTTAPKAVTVTFTYDDGWGGDGDGSSLEKKDPAVADRNSLEVDRFNWCPSEPKSAHGTPGKKNSRYAGQISSMVMYHTPVSEGFLGIDVVVKAEIKSNLPMTTVKLNYRIRNGGTAFSNIDMAVVPGTNLYQGRIPTEAVTLSGIEYYILATDSGGNTVSSPPDLVQQQSHLITVKDVTPKLKLIIPDKGISNGELFYADVKLENVTDCYGVTFELSYPSTILTVQDSDANRPGVQILVGNFMIAGFNEQNSADKDAGRISFSVKGLSKAVTGSGVIATIQFKNGSDVAATHDLVFSNCLVENKSHAVVSPALFNGKVKIGGGSSDLIDAEGGLISGPSTMKLRIPEGAFKYPVRVTVNKLTALADFPDMSGLDGNPELKPVYIGYRIEPETEKIYKTIEFVFPYTKEEIEAVGIESDQEKFLTVYRYDPDEMGWFKTGGDVSTGGNTVTAKIVKFGTYLLVLDTSVPKRFYVRNLYASPNPFSPNGNNIQDRTIISYELSGDAKVLLRIFNVKGEEIRRLLDEDEVIQGVDTREWDGRDDFGEIQPTGIYVIHVRAEEIVPTDWGRKTKRLAEASETVVISKHLME